MLLEVEQELSLKPKKIEQKKKRNWNIEFASGAFSSIKSYDLQVEETHLSILPTRSVDLGLNIEYEINKNWIVGSGVHYQQNQFEADYEMHFDYASQGEIKMEEGYAKAYTHRVPSLLSELDAEIVLVRSTDANVDTGSDIAVDVELSHATQFVQIPVYLKFIQHTGQWSYYLKTGVSANFVLEGLSTDHLTTASQHDAIHHHSSSFELVNNEPIAQNKVAYRLFSAVGAQYQANAKWYLFAEPTFSTELQPIYPNKAVDENVSNFGGSRGVGRRF